MTLIIHPTGQESGKEKRKESVKISEQILTSSTQIKETANKREAYKI